VTRQQHYRGRTDGLLSALNPRDGVLRRGVRAIRTKWKIPLAILLRRSVRLDAVIGVTGSAGKSTTCRLIAAVLEANDVVHLGFGINTTDGIRRSFLRKPAKARLWVQEISGHEHEAMKASVAFVRPTVGVVTTIGMDHISHYKSREAIADAKAQLVEALPANGVAILNADDPLVAAMAARTKARIVTYGRGNGADIRLMSSSSGYPKRLAMRVRLGDDEIDIQTRFIGGRWETSVLAAMATATALGIDPLAAAKAIGSVEPELFKDQVEVHAGVTFIVDALKAPYWTIASSIEILAAAEAPRKLMLFGTISDYRGTARTKYVTAAKAALAEAEIVIFYGPQAERVSRLMAENRERLFTFDTFDALMAFLKETLRPGDLISIKASGIDHLERVMLDYARPVTCRTTNCGKIFACNHCKHLDGEPPRHVL
jgi:UDP-N-acetylmuramoyl-tripeptide--D-alanyl-D-alanine ligase